MKIIKKILPLMFISSYLSHAAADEIQLSSSLTLKDGDVISLQPSGYNSGLTIANLLDGNGGNINALDIGFLSGVDIIDNEYYQFTVDVLDENTKSISLSPNHPSYKGQYLKRFYNGENFIIPYSTRSQFSKFRIESNGGNNVFIQVDNGQYLGIRYSDNRSVITTSNIKKDFVISKKVSDIEEPEAEQASGLSKNFVHSYDSSVEGYPKYKTVDRNGVYLLLPEADAGGKSYIAFNRRLMPVNGKARLSFSYKNCSATGKPGRSSTQANLLGIRLGEKKPEIASQDIDKNDLSLKVNTDGKAIDILFLDDSSGENSRRVNIFSSYNYRDVYRYAITADQYTNCSYTPVSIEIDKDNKLSIYLNNQSVVDNVQLPDEQVEAIYSSPVIVMASDSRLYGQHPTSVAIRNISYSGTDAGFSAQTYNAVKDEEYIRDYAPKYSYDSVSKSTIMNLFESVDIPLSEMKKKYQEWAANPTEENKVKIEELFKKLLGGKRSVLLPAPSNAEFGISFDYKLCIADTYTTGIRGIDLGIAFNSKKPRDNFFDTFTNPWRQTEGYAFVLNHTDTGNAFERAVAMENTADFIADPNFPITPEVGIAGVVQTSNTGLLNDCTWHNVIFGAISLLDPLTHNAELRVYHSSADADLTGALQNDSNYELILTHQVSGDELYDLISNPVTLSAQKQSANVDFQIRNLTYDANMRVDEPHHTLTRSTAILDVAEKSFRADNAEIDLDNTMNEDPRFEINTTSNIVNTDAYNMAIKSAEFSNIVVESFANTTPAHVLNMHKFHLQFQSMYALLRVNINNLSDQLGGYPSSRGNVWVNAVGSYLNKLKADSSVKDDQLTDSQKLGKKAYEATIKDYIGVTNSHGDVLTRSIIDTYFTGTFLRYGGFAKVTNTESLLNSYMGKEFLTYKDKVSARQYGAGDFPIPNPAITRNPADWGIFYGTAVPSLWAYISVAMNNYKAVLKSHPILPNSKNIDAFNQFYALNGHNGSKLYDGAEALMDLYQTDVFYPGIGITGTELSSVSSANRFEPMVVAAHYIRKTIKDNLLPEGFDSDVSSACLNATYDYELVRDCYYPQLQIDLNKVSKAKSKLVDRFVNPDLTEHFTDVADLFMMLMPFVEEVAEVDAIGTLLGAFDSEGLAMTEFAEEGLPTFEAEAESLEGSLAETEAENLEAGGMCLLP